jgi:hypothetical protein
LGLFPKSLLVVLRTYKHGLPQNKQDDFDLLFSRLLSLFIYQPIVLQKIIHYLISKMKLTIAETSKERDAAIAGDVTPALLAPYANDSASASRPINICFASKCAKSKSYHSKANVLCQSKKHVFRVYS